MSILLKIEVRDGEPMFSETDKKIIRHFYKTRKCKYIEISFKNAQSPKSVQQLGYLHAVVFPIIGEELGYDMDDIKFIYKDMLLKSYKLIGGKEYEYTKSLADLTIKEMAEFITKVIDHATYEYFIYIPPPTRFNENFKMYNNVA